jgi:hypothetical protein
MSSLHLGTQSINSDTQVWEFPFDGIVQITPIKGPLGDDQIEIMLSSAEKVDELVTMCLFTESNPTYSKYGFGSSKVNQLILWGPGTHATLLDTLKSAITPNKDATAFRYTLIQ